MVNFADGEADDTVALETVSAVAACGDAPLDSDPIAGHFTQSNPGRGRTRDTLIGSAQTAINGEREQEYGNASENFDRIAALWEVVFGHGVTVEQVALCLDLLKTARLIENPTHRDSWVDKIGYSALGGELALSQDAI